jgi:hypothetical protein
MTELTEFTGILRIELLENIYPAISLSYGDEMPNLLDWRDNIDYADWELED